MDKAVLSGLRLRPIEDTARDVLEWWRSSGLDRPLKAGLSPEREAEILAAGTGAESRRL